MSLTAFLLIHAVVTLSGSAPSRWHAWAVAGCGGVGGLLGWWWVIFRERHTSGKSPKP